MTQSQWLIRTSSSQILGPVSREVLCEKILKQELSLDDEVCPGNGYWFYLYQSEEVRTQLGLQFVPTKKSTDAAASDDITETRTEDAVAQVILPQTSSNAPTSEPVTVLRTPRVERSRVIEFFGWVLLALVLLLIAFIFKRISG